MVFFSIQLCGMVIIQTCLDVMFVSIDYELYVPAYQTMALELDSWSALYASGKSRTSENRLCDKYDACTAPKEYHFFVHGFRWSTIDCFCHHCLFNGFGLTKYSAGDSLEAT